MVSYMSKGTYGEIITELGTVRSLVTGAENSFKMAKSMVEEAEKKMSLQKDIGEIDKKYLEIRAARDEAKALYDTCADEVARLEQEITVQKEVKQRLVESRDGELKKLNGLTKMDAPIFESVRQKIATINNTISETSATIEKLKQQEVSLTQDELVQRKKIIDTQAEMGKESAEVTKTIAEVRYKENLIVSISQEIENLNITLTSARTEIEPKTKALEEAKEKLAQAQALVGVTTSERAALGARLAMQEEAFKLSQFEIATIEASRDASSERSDKLSTHEAELEKARNIAKTRSEALEKTRKEVESCNTKFIQNTTAVEEAQSAVTNAEKELSDVLCVCNTNSTSLECKEGDLSRFNQEKLSLEQKVIKLVEEQKVGEREVTEAQTMQLKKIQQEITNTKKTMKTTQDSLVDLDRELKENKHIFNDMLKYKSIQDDISHIMDEIKKPVDIIRNLEDILSNKKAEADRAGDIYNKIISDTEDAKMQYCKAHSADDSVVKKLGTFKTTCIEKHDSAKAACDALLAKLRESDISDSQKKPMEKQITDLISKLFGVQARFEGLATSITMLEVASAPKVDESAVSATAHSHEDAESSTPHGGATGYDSAATLGDSSVVDAPDTM